AVGGGLDGPTLGLSATWSPRPLELAPDVEAERLAREGLDEEAVRLDDWDLQFLGKVLSPDGDTLAESTGAPQTDDAFLAGIGAEKPIWGPVDLSVRAFTAVAGELGGYREAGLGLKYEFDAIDLVETGRFYVQYHAGLGGGGDVDVGHGLLHQFAAGWRFAPLPGLALGVEFGHFSSDSGTFEGDSYAATVTWVLSRPAERL
ncbi:MAG TPA: hypothetical protein VJP77_06750, partial [Planctomycetota bacterium]|nr:hypothetical protein [Planctomycetota bacterium]